jgi:hypothetical protein
MGAKILTKAAQKKIVKAITNLMDDKAYVKKQIRAGKDIDSSKLKAGKIAKISL